MEKTVLTLETASTCYYIDHNEETGNFDVWKDEKFYFRRQSLADCLQLLFEKLGITNFKSIR